MKRREFVKATIRGLAGAMAFEGSNVSASSKVEPALSLGNGQIGWEFSRGGNGIISSGLRNKVTGQYHPLKNAKELRLTFSAAKERIEIPWWRCAFGGDNGAASPENERGYLDGYQRADFDDSKWQTSLNLCLRNLDSRANLAFNQGRPPIVYRGYGWFRAGLKLPQTAQGETVFLNLGGYDPTDWEEYWVYVNGIEAGHRTTSGPWRTPGQFQLKVGSDAYNALNFGTGRGNVVAVRTRSYDRHFGNLSEDILVRHIFDPILCDQFVSVGEPYHTIDDFEVLAVEHHERAGRPAIAVKMENRQERIQATLHYELEGSIRRKWAEIRNDSPDRKLLLDVDLDRFQMDGEFANGGYGYPVTIEDQVFAAIEHPSGFNRWESQTLHLTHFPGKWIERGQEWRSHSAIIAVTLANSSNRGFLDYLEAHTVRRKKILALYDPFGITAFTEGTSWALNDDQNLGTLDLLEDWQKKGIRFDFYIPDMSLDTTSDLKRFRLFSFPDGPAEMIERVNQLGMKFGQWFAVTSGIWSDYRYPKTKPSRIPLPNAEDKVLFRNDYTAGWGGHELCVGSEPYFSILRDAIVFHIKENRVRLIKLDTGNYYCNSITHGHLPGKYSTEACLEKLVEIATAAHTADPDVFIVWYWGAYSPFLALHGDVIFDIRLSMEAASTGDYPALFFRDAATQALDQGSHFAQWVPPMNHDSLGVWMANNWWGNQMETVRWKEGLIMDLARGNLLFPQIWGDLNNFERHDVEFLARIQSVVKHNERVFLTRRHALGNPWKDEIYGYSYFDDEHGFVFLNNMSFDLRKAALRLDEGIGLRGSRRRSVRLLTHYPEVAELVRSGNAEFQTGEEVQIQLRPFEVMMIEVQSAEEAKGLTAPSRETIETAPRFSYHPSVNQIPAVPDLEIDFADAEKLAGKGCKKRYATFEARLPNYSGGRYHLAIVNTFKKDNRWWRQNQMSEFAQAIAKVDNSVVEFTQTPDFRQNGNNQWCPWIVFSAPLPRSFAGKQIQFGISSYLPVGVDATTDLWLVKEWWPRRMRSLPNYWV